MARFEDLSVQQIRMSTVTTPAAGSLLSLTLTPAQVNTVVAAKQTFTVAGLKVGDYVAVLSNPITNAVALCQAEVSAADTLRLMFVNPTGGNLTPTTGTYTFLVIKGS
jgi:hypothetical protein